MVEQPTDRAFDNKPSAIEPQRAAVLRTWPRAVLAVRTDEFNVSRAKPFAQGVAIRCPVIDQAARSTANRAFLQQRLDQIDFGVRSAGDINRQGETSTVNVEHDLGAFPLFGFANAVAPFFAGENVPSAKVSSQLTWLRALNRVSNRAQAARNTPDSVHSLIRRQHVLGDGKCVGKSFQRAPVRKTQRMPSRHGRGGTGGRPPSSDGGSWGNRSAIKNHCSSVSSGVGSILEPVQLRRRVACFRRVAGIQAPPFA
jgi:hypothetical protein